MLQTYLKLCALSLAVAGCSTSGAIDPINAFSQGVTAAVTDDIQSSVDSKLANRVAAQKRKDFASKGVAYSLSDRAVCNFAEAALIQSEIAYEEGCQLVPKGLSQDETSTVDVASAYDTAAQQNAVIERGGYVIAAGDEALLNEYHASLLRTELLNYAMALSELATSDAPTQVGTAATTAFNSVTSLIDTVSAATSQNNQPAPASALRDPARSLISLAATEITEARRFRLLRDIVNDTDASIYRASIQLARISYLGQKSDFEKIWIDLRSAVDNNVVSSAKNLETIENIYQTALDANNSAEFQPYLKIASAHAAIAASLNKPGDLQSLAEASGRVAALVEAVEAVQAAR